jgi:hypothetical protein
MYARQHISQRTSILSCDVVDAIKLLVDPERLPAAFAISDIAKRLVIMAHTSEDGTLGSISPMVLHNMTDIYYHRLTTTAVFRHGYKGYENSYQNTVIPVTKYFFRKVFNSSGYCNLYIEAMSDNQVQHSLPKRTTTHYEVTADDDVIEFEFGRVAGIVILPSHYPCNLLGAWYERASNIVGGQEEAFVRRGEIALPGHAAVAHLRSLTQKGDMVRENSILPGFRPMVPDPEEEDVST